MGQWRTVLRYPGCRQTTVIDAPIKIERGIFQGDSLSPLWFCLALNPLSTLLEGSGLGYRLQKDDQVISHLLHMDDLKLLAPTELQLSALLKVTENFSNSIKMEFGVDKCAVMYVKKGEIVESEGIELSDSTKLRSLSATETYKYFGISQSLGIPESDMKETLQERFFGRLKKVLKSLLSGGNKAQPSSQDLHQQLALKYHLVNLEVPYYRYVPDPVLENGRATLYWDRSIITDRTIVANKPDIVVIDRLERRAMIVGIAVPHDENLVKVEKEKQIRYLDLSHEIVDMWNVDSVIIVPIVVSAHGLIAKSLDQHLKRLTLDGWIKGLIQKAVLLDTARTSIVRRFLSLQS
ncbi:unnamed protein product [Arctia plantaginis]|uniref:Reverse transcriptase domain-containing protein n=1 Tax=Arctia plantaginis TaxID=874455 RepID=A0A8S1BQ81_ARCPL|nr:unnamed protein product [Arctia plantaginis]